MIHFILIFILGSWIFWAFVREPLSKLIGFKICAICAAVSGTWVLIWLTRVMFNYTVDKLILAILMGQSVAGLMYTFEKHIKKNKYDNKWLLLRILVITLGALFVYLTVKYMY